MISSLSKHKRAIFTVVVVLSVLSFFVSGQVFTAASEAVADVAAKIPYQRFIQQVNRMLANFMIPALK